MNSYLVCLDQVGYVLLHLRTLDCTQP